jgi:chromate reductase, NAD(P)H dehydrogenase (quinone)
MTYTGTNPCRVLLVSGSLRSRSTNTAVLRTAQDSAPEHVVTVMYRGLAELPHFNPDDDVDPLPQAVAVLRAAIRAADALLFSTPEYAGALPGSFKNLLDWTIGDEQPRSMYNKPVAWINSSFRGADDAHDSLRKVLGYAHSTIVEEACVHIPVTSTMVGDDDLIAEASVRREIARVLDLLVDHFARFDV